MKPQHQTGSIHVAANGDAIATVLFVPTLNTHKGTHFIPRDEIEKPFPRLPAPDVKASMATRPPLVGLTDHEWRWVSPGTAGHAHLPRSNPVED